MCINCARSTLDNLKAAFPPSSSPLARWPICLLDHGDHIHIRVRDNAGGASEWVRLDARRAEVLPLLPPNVSIHFHDDDDPDNPAAEGVVDALERITWHAGISAKHHSVGFDSGAGAGCGRSGDDEPCSVCFEQFGEGDEVAVLPCPGRHRYHLACVTEWLKKQNTCPQCRFELTAASIAAAAAGTAAGSALGGGAAPDSVRLRPVGGSVGDSGRTDASGLRQRPAAAAAADRGLAADASASAQTSTRRGRRRPVGQALSRSACCTIA